MKSIILLHDTNYNNNNSNCNNDNNNNNNSNCNNNGNYNRFQVNPTSNVVPRQSRFAQNNQFNRQLFKKPKLKSKSKSQGKET